MIPGALGDLDELRGRDVAALGMVPAQQRLDADQPLVVERELRLVVQGELVVGLQRAAQVAEQGQARRRVDALPGSKITAPALAPWRSTSQCPRAQHSSGVVP